MPTTCFLRLFENHGGFLRLQVPLSARSYEYLIIGARDSFLACRDNLFSSMRAYEKHGASNLHGRKGCWRAGNHLQTGALSVQMTWALHLKMALAIPSFLFKWENLPSLCLKLNILNFTSRSAYNGHTSCNKAYRRGVACSQACVAEIVAGRSQTTRG